MLFSRARDNPNRFAVSSYQQKGGSSLFTLLTGGVQIMSLLIGTNHARGLETELEGGNIEVELEEGYP